MERRPHPYLIGISASRDGSIWSTRRGAPRKLKPRTGTPYGHQRFNVWDRASGKVRTYWVHRVVAEAWLGQPGYADANLVLHINGDAGDNRVANLRWGTDAENRLDWSEGYRRRRQEAARKERERQEAAAPGVDLDDIPF